MTSFAHVNIYIIYLPVEVLPAYLIEKLPFPIFAQYLGQYYNFKASFSGSDLDFSTFLQSNAKLFIQIKTFLQDFRYISILLI